MDIAIDTERKLKASERKTLKKEMRKEHGAATAIASSLNVSRARLYEAVDGNRLPENVINAIRTYLQSKKQVA